MDDFFVILDQSDDPDYGYTPEKPIDVGGSSEGMGPYNERKYISSLRGPNGEQLSYHRVQSCCAFDTPNGFGGKGLLDVYEVSWEGAEEPVRLYINMYDEDRVMAPVGFTIRTE
jgi:hypothetical protein